MTALDANALSGIVGHPAVVNGDVAKITIARTGHMHDRGIWGKGPADTLARAFRAALDAQAAASESHARAP